jgi:hypothetical protein
VNAAIAQPSKFETGGRIINYPKMDGCIELTSPTDPDTTYFMKDGAMVAKRVMSTQRGYAIESWYIGGKLGRLGDLPAVIHHDGQKIREYWYKDGNRGRLGDLPAEIHYRNGQKTHECWYKDGYIHRDGDLSAMIHYENGQKTSERWYKDGKEYMPAKPSMASDDIAKVRALLAEIEAILAKA